MNSGTDYLPILFSASILPESGTAEGTHDAIITFLEEKKEWMQKWQEVLARDFPDYEHNIDHGGINLAKLGNGGNVMTDGCNGARKFNRMMVDTIRKKAKEARLLTDDIVDETIGDVIVQSIAGTAAHAEVESDVDDPASDAPPEDGAAVGSEEDSSDDEGSCEDNSDRDDERSMASDSSSVSPDPALAMESYCHHHIRNVWWGGLIKETSKILRKSLSGSLDGIDSRLRISPNMKNILHSLDKCFSLPANYPKGNGTEFKYWAHRYHPGVPLYPVQRSTGSRNDMVLEGAVAAYINAWLYKLFLDEALSIPKADNILQENLFIILSSVEMTALSRLFSILHFSINVPMRWLAGKTHTLAEYDWSMKKMSTAIDRLHDALVEIEEDGTKILEEKFMLSIFKPLHLPPLDEYMKYIFDEKKSPTTSNEKSSSKRNMTALGRYIRKELFAPTREENIATSSMIEEIGADVATSLVEEMRHPDKLTSEHLSSEGGRLSWLNTTTAEHEASKGKEATNDNSESPFGRLTAQLQLFSTIGIGHASALAIARYNKDFYRSEVELSKRRNRKDGKDESIGKNGNFFDLDCPMAESLLQTALELSSEVRQTERDALDRQQQRKQEKKAALLKERLEAATKAYVDKLYYREMFDSAACWKTCKQVDSELKKIKSPSGKKEALKDQIKMRVLGLGWEDCHHAWSKGGNDFSPAVLAKHLKEGIIQKHKTRKIPKKPPIDYPTRKELPILGTLSPDIIRHDAEKAAKEIELMKEAEKLMKELEEKGLGDRMADMQQKSAPKVDATLVGKRIEVLSRYFDEDGEPMYVWAKGEVTAIPVPKAKAKGGKGRGNGKKSNAKTTVSQVAIVTWDKEYWGKDKNDNWAPAITSQKLVASKWNKHSTGAWRFVLGEDKIN